jgi:type IV pilus assembly protein PilY1
VYNLDTSVTPPAERLVNGALGTNAKAQIYVGMRRGGRFYYSLDVTDPDAPVFKWKIDNTMADFAELGQTWSEAKVVKVKIASSKCPSALDSQGNCKVLVFGAGYDAPANDVEPQGTATMGRGIFVVDATTGAHIWSASPVAFTAAAGYHKHVPGMTFAIPADMSVINSDLDVQNVADRIYAVDTAATSGASTSRTPIRRTGGRQACFAQRRRCRGQAQIPVPARRRGVQQHDRLGPGRFRRPRASLRYDDREPLLHDQGTRTR